VSLALDRVDEHSCVAGWIDSIRSQPLISCSNRVLQGCEALGLLPPM
jgi:hypothetical protein